MRSEVLSFVQQVEASRPPGSRSDDLAAVKAFDFVTVKSELVLDGIYLRLFVNTRTISDIENPSKFSVLLIDEIHKFLKGKSSVVPEDHQMLLVETLKIISEDAHYVAGDISRSTNGVNTVLMLISLPSESPLLPPAIVALKALTADKAFVSALSARPVCVTALLRCICSTSLNRTSSSTLWAALETFSMSAEGLQALLDRHIVPLMLALIFSIPGFNGVYQNRQAAAGVLASLMAHPVKGGEVLISLKRFGESSNSCYCINLVNMIQSSDSSRSL